MGYGNDEYSIKTFSDNNYIPKTFSGGHYGSSGYRDLASRGSGYAGDHYGSYSGGGDCCPLVVDPLTYAALLGFLAAAVYFFQVLIEMSMLMMAKKRRRKRELNFRSNTVSQTFETLSAGKSHCRNFSRYHDLILRA